jgi:hypothetical protein
MKAIIAASVTAVLLLAAAENAGAHPYWRHGHRCIRVVAPAPIVYYDAPVYVAPPRAVVCYRPCAPRVCDRRWHYRRDRW